MWYSELGSVSSILTGRILCYFNSAIFGKFIWWSLFATQAVRTV